MSQASAAFELAVPRKVKGLDTLPPAPAPAPVPDADAYGRTIWDTPAPRFVAVPRKVPLKTDRAMGCAVGVMVTLPRMICGAPTEGNIVVEGTAVKDPGAADEDGVDCWECCQCHKRIWYCMGGIAKTRAGQYAGGLPTLTGAMVKLAVIAAKGTFEKVRV